MQPCAKHTAELPGHPESPTSVRRRADKEGSRPNLGIRSLRRRRAAFSTAFGKLPEMRDSYPEPAAGCNPLAGSFHWFAQSRARRVERTDSHHPTETCT